MQIQLAHSSSFALIDSTMTVRGHVLRRLMMALFRTDRGRVVQHCHVPGASPCKAHDVTASEIEEARDYMQRHFPDAREVRPPTWKYSCVGFALANRHGWFESTHALLADNYFEVDMAQPRVDDVVVYFNFDINRVAHVAIVTEVDDDEIVELRSKWGANAEMLHTLYKVPKVYGKPISLVRRI